MSTEGFTSPIVGGDGTLVIDQIQSSNYVAGTSGWQETKTGDAEFNNVNMRGKLTVTGTNGSVITVRNNGSYAEVGLLPAPYTDPTVINNEGYIAVDRQGSSGTEMASLQIGSPYPSKSPSPSAVQSTLNLYSSSLDGTSFTARIEPSSELRDASSQISYKPVQTGTVNVSFSAVASFSVAVTFPKQFMTTPVVIPNINTAPGATARWVARAINITQLGFTLFVFAADNVANTWSNIPVSWLATAQ